MTIIDRPGASWSGNPLFIHDRDDNRYQTTGSSYITTSSSASRTNSADSYANDESFARFDSTFTALGDMINRLGDSSDHQTGGSYSSKPQFPDTKF